MNYIGIDLGTSAVKLLLCDGRGKILSEVSESYPVYTPHAGWSEQNPEDWFDAVLRGLERLGGEDVAGISFGGQMHGLVALDEHDNVIRPCILWNDGRTERQTEWLNNVFGREKLSACTGNIAFAGFTAPKLLWLKENEPQNFAKISKIMLPKDYMAYRLTGTFCTDYSDASGTLLLDVKNRRWSQEMCDVCGIYAEQLSRLYESYAPVGYVKSCYRGIGGIGERTVVAAGAGDNAAAAIGTGTVYDGACNISLGTSGTLFISADKFFSDKNNALHSFAHANGRYHLMGCLLSAASANKWWTEDILGANYSLAEQARDIMGKNEVLFLPYLSGERSPHNDVNARGAFIGLTSSATRAQMSLAVLEGVAFAFRDCLNIAVRDGVSVTSSTICGGGAKSRLWCEIMADVLGIRIDAVKTEQGPSYGAAILAMVACGEYPSVEEAVGRIIRRVPLVQPDEKISALYNQRYAAFSSLYPALKNWFKENA